MQHCYWCWSFSTDLVLSHIQLFLILCYTHQVNTLNNIKFLLYQSQKSKPNKKNELGPGRGTECIPCFHWWVQKWLLSPIVVVLCFCDSLGWKFAELHRHHWSFQYLCYPMQHNLMVFQQPLFELACYFHHWETSFFHYSDFLTYFYYNMK